MWIIYANWKCVNCAHNMIDVAPKRTQLRRRRILSCNSVMLHSQQNYRAEWLKYLQKRKKHTYTRIVAEKMPDNNIIYDVQSYAIIKSRFVERFIHEQNRLVKRLLCYDLQHLPVDGNQRFLNSTIVICNRNRLKLVWHLRQLMK